jgi:uncharacterized delta-60 repeat protein
MKRLLQFLILCLTSISFAQDGTLDMTFNPLTGAENGNVNSVGLQSDGKAIVGGDFLRLNHIPCVRLGRLNPDGTTDTTFNLGLGFNNTVSAINIQTDGKILVGGDFTSFNGLVRNRILRLNPDGTIDPTFNIGTGANNNIYSITMQPDGKIIVTGSFTSFNNNAKSRICRLNPDGSVDTTFNSAAAANNSVYTSVVQPDGKILLGGNFTTCNGVVRNRIARINADGSLDTAFDTTVGANNSIKSIGLQSDGKIVIGGSFTSYNGTTSNRIARINSDSTVDATFNVGSGFDFGVNFIISQPDGRLIVGGNFFSYNDTNCVGIARIDSNGTIDAPFSSNPNSGTDAAVNSIAIRPNGKILAVGSFSNCNGYLRSRIANMNANGSIDTGFYPYLRNGNSTDGDIRTMAVQSDGKIVIGGFFNSYHGMPRNNIARLNADGSLDLSFNVGTGTDVIIHKLAITSDNKIIIIGEFVTYNGVTRNRIARLNADGTLDTSFTTSANFIINALLIQPDGKIIIGGIFTTVNGTPRNGLARLNADGTLDTSFNIGTGPEGGILALALQPDGKIIIGGGFSSYNGNTCSSLARLNSNGSFDTTFNMGGAGAHYLVYSCDVQTDGKIVIGGAFDTYNNVAMPGAARLNANGSIDASFNCSSFSNTATIYASLFENDGKIVLGGVFPAFNGFTSSNILRLNADGSLDNTFISGTGFDAYVTALARQADGKILAGGNFATYNQVEKKYIARLYDSSTLGLADFDSDEKIIFYPNPVNDFLKVSNHIAISHFEVFDITGKKIDSNVLDENIIDVRKYTSGVYILHFKTEKGISICKFIKR